MKYIKLSLLLLVILTTNVLAQKPVLKFNNGKFKIVQFTDLHWVADAKHAVANDSTIRLMKYVITTEKPDLVIFTGDVVVSGGAAKAWKDVTNPLAELKVPFAVAFGNHDTETDITKQKALEIIQTNPYNVTYNADKNIAGIGNCTLPIKGSEGSDNKWVVYMFDSHAYASQPDTLVKGYDWIKNNQIQWYRAQSASFTKSNNGKALPSLAFFHIPLPEYEYVRLLKTTVGNISEPVCAPYFNSGLFTSFIEMRDVLGIFVGHDHNDDFVGTTANICFGYGRKTGYNAAYEEILERGARVIELYENDKKFDTHIRTLSGSSLNYSFKRQ
jgi:3',5'-cyclic AMP phosphodiesterase CpdA